MSAANSSNDTQDRDFVAALERGLAVLVAFNQERDSLTITDVANATQMTRAAARRYLLTLTRLGYLVNDEKQFAITPKVLGLAQSYWHSTRLPRLVGEHLQRLSSALGGAATVAVLDGNDIITVRAATDGSVLSPSTQPGARLPAHCTANGRVLLAASLETLKDAAQIERIESISLTQLTSHTVMSRDRLTLELRRTASQGYALTQQEFEINMHALAVPLKNKHDLTVAPLNIIFNRAQRGTNLIEQCLPALLRVQAELREAL
ncbi:MAG: IclR family transcriptional regulator [Betaproteobacteria bacterium]|nr:MAG: IclR family transcriptional regulator [Betaproteobacteria bacterium]